MSTNSSTRYPTVTAVSNGLAPAPVTPNANPLVFTQQPGARAPGWTTTSGNAADYIGGDTASHPLASGVWKGLLTKSAAYNLTTTDSGKYVICSGGSWVLGLPTPALGLVYWVRNDMGITGTTGTITVTPASGTIDGAANLAILAAQEVMVVTDGTNWRTFGLKREVILGTQVIQAATASGSFLLPVGYRHFEIFVEQAYSDTDNISLQAQISTDGGTTWIADGLYREGVLYDSSGTTAAYFYGSPGAGLNLLTYVPLSSGSASAQGRCILSPGGSSPLVPTWQSHSGGYTSASGRERNWIATGFHNAVGLANALKWFTTSGNITNMYLTVKGVV